MHPLINAQPIADYLLPLLKSAESYYDWSFDCARAEEVSGVRFSVNDSWIVKRGVLKSALSKRLHEDADPALHLKIAKYFISEWGGVTSNKYLEVVLEDVRKCIKNGREYFNDISLKGVSTWSKYLSLMQDWAPIYDSRVSYSINAINLMAGQVHQFYCMPAGRSPRLNLIDIETLFVLPLIAGGQIDSKDLQCSHFASRCKKKFHIPTEKTYGMYIELLDAVTLNLADDISSDPEIRSIDRHIVEAMLFAIAPTKVLSDLVSHVAASANKSPVRW